MKHTISASNLLISRHLKVDDQGVEFRESALFGGRRRFRFDQIDCILLTPKGVLSLQVGREIVSIPTKRDNRKHQAAIEALVREVKVSHAG